MNIFVEIKITQTRHSKSVVGGWIHGWCGPTTRPVSCQAGKKKVIVVCFSYEIMIVIDTNKSFSTRIALILLNLDLSFYEEQ